MQFYVYTHARPGGGVFYVGKGSGRRAWDFSPSRRRGHHSNIIAKHGRSQIEVQVYPCASEDHALRLEVEMIAQFRAAGAVLVNLTDGGEGTAGRPMNEASAQAFAASRGPQHYQSLSPDAKASILEGLERGRQKGRAWKASPAGQAQIRSLGQLSAQAMRDRPFIDIVCARCGVGWKCKKPTTKYCAPCSKNGARDARVRG